MSAAIRILGIDPGLRRTGWGIIAVEGSRLHYLACGSINPPPAMPMAERLKHVHDGLRDVFAAHAPHEAAIEETFVNKDAQATLKLGQARGVAMLCCALHDIAVAEYAPNLIKKTIVGSGHADKAQIQMMVRVLLPKSDPKSDDAADALAIALAHAQHRGIKKLG
ncbi:MAG: crossover junction endodeoxyribonuclease RuvC [Beijerinckiaceae bacterium]